MGDANPIYPEQRGKKRKEKKMADALTFRPEGSNGRAAGRRRVVTIYQTRHFTSRRSQYGLTSWLVIAGALSALFDCRPAWRERLPIAFRRGAKRGLPIKCEEAGALKRLVERKETASSKHGRRERRF